MRKPLFIIMALLLWTTAAAAQQAAGTAALEVPFETDIRAGGWFVRTDESAGRAAKYDYLHASGAGALRLEWDPLPHRFVLDSYYLNETDYFADMDYAWKDIVVVNFLTRSLFHNLEHLSIGTDDPSTPLPSFTDRDPLDQYGVETNITRTFLRLKMPDFPFHVYAEARQIEREGTVQQRFLHANNLFPSAKISQSREIETQGLEVTVGTNSHLGPVELDYSHTEKKVEEKGEKVLSEPFLSGPNSFQHNLVPDLKSSADSVKLHTSLTGRLVASATYTAGDKTNEDSNSKADYSMAAGDVTWIPVNDLALFLKYRHYETDFVNPDVVTATTMGGAVTYNVRDSLSSKRDVITGSARYRATDRFWVKAEYNVEAFDRDVGPVGSNVPGPPANTSAAWNLPAETTKGTAKLGAIYRITKAMLFRADYSHLEVDNPAYETDPDTGDYAKATVTWTPVKTVNVAVGYNGAREKRDLLDPPLAGGEREASRDQAFGSVTLLLGKRSSVTTSYSYFKIKVAQGITFDVEVTPGVIVPTIDNDVPYTDKAQTGSLAVTHAPMDGVTLSLEAKRTYGKGSFQTSGSAAGTDGVAGLSDLKLVESEYAAGIDVEYTRQLGYELRYRFLESDDKLDNTLDGTAQTLLATVSMKW
jgi:hypothetical protein